MLRSSPLSLAKQIEDTRKEIRKQEAKVRQVPRQIRGEIQDYVARLRKQLAKLESEFDS